MRLVVTVVAALALTASAPAWAQGNAGSSRTGSGRDAAPTSASASGGDATPRSQGRTATLSRTAIARGMTAYVARNYDDALAAFRQAAAASEADRAEATLYIGFTLAARNDGDGAMSSFRDAARISGTANDHFNHLRALQAIANRLEATGHWADAQSAWEEFVSFASAHPDLGNAANGRARINAIRQRGEFEHQYEVVRQRIEERRRQNAQGPRPQG